MILKIGFSEIDFIEFIVILKHFSGIGLFQLLHIAFKTLIIKVLKNIVHCFQPINYLLAVLTSLEINIFQEGAEVVLSIFSKSVRKEWGL